MSNERIDLLVLQLDHIYDHDWESLSDVLSGVTAEEADWQLTNWSDPEDETDDPNRPPPTGTIHWQVWHLSMWKAWYTQRLLTPPEEKVPEHQPPPLPWAEERARLDEMHARQREALANLDDAALDIVFPNGRKMVDFIASNLRHDLWHAGQIALMRRMYKTRDAAH